MYLSVGNWLNEYFVVRVVLKLRSTPLHAKPWLLGEPFGGEVKADQHRKWGISAQLCLVCLDVACRHALSISGHG